MTDLIPVFDGHNDILYRLLMAPAAREAIWLTGEGKGHLDLPRMKAAALRAGCSRFTCHRPPRPRMRPLRR